MRHFRGSGRVRARALARFVFDTLRGAWEVGQMPDNLRAQAFWRSVIGERTGGRFVEHRLDDATWVGCVQCFVAGDEHAVARGGS